MGRVAGRYHIPLVNATQAALLAFGRGAVIAARTSAFRAEVRGANSKSWKSTHSTTLYWTIMVGATESSVTWTYGQVRPDVQFHWTLFLKLEEEWVSLMQVVCLALGIGILKIAEDVLNAEVAGIHSECWKGHIL